MWKMFSANNNTVYWDKIDKLVDDYNKIRHSSIKMKPVDASKRKMRKTFCKFVRRTNLFETSKTKVCNW